MKKPICYQLFFAGVAINYLVAPVRIGYFLLTFFLPAVASLIPNFFEIARIFFNMAFGVIVVHLLINSALLFIESLLQQTKAYIIHPDNKKFFVPGWIFLIMALFNIAFISEDILANFFITLKIPLFALCLANIGYLIFLYRRHHRQKKSDKISSI